MPGSDSPASSADRPVETSLALALWIALATSAGELAILGIQHLVFGRVLHLSRDVVWMIPAANLLLFGAVFTGLRVTGIVLPRAALRRVALMIYFFLGTAALLFLVPSLANYAVLLAAMGIAWQGTRLLLPRPGLDRFIRRTLKWQVTVFTLGIGGYLGVHAIQERRAAAGQKVSGSANVLLIVLDSVRALSMRLYGYHRPTTPALDSLARTGTVFRHAWAPSSWTLPSHASMFTGRAAIDHKADWLRPLDARYPVIAEAFARQGYATAGFAANTIYTSYEHGLSRGFQHYEDYGRNLGEILYSSSLIRKLSDSRAIRRLVGYNDIMGRRNAAEVNRRFLGWLDSRKAPFFAFLNYYDAHAPVLPPAPYDTMFSAAPRRYLGQLRYWNHQAGFPYPGDLTAAQQVQEVAAYDAVIAYLDRQVGLLLDQLKRQGILRNTVVIITSDHGEMFGENGMYSHGNNLYRAVLEVPLIILAPGRVPAGTWIETPVTLTDLGATALQLAGIPAGDIPGNSLAAAWQAGAAPSSTPVLSTVTWDQSSMRHRAQLDGGMHSIVADGFHYLRNADGTEELYALADSAEAQNLAGDSAQQDRVRRSREQLDAAIRSSVPR